MPPDSEAGPRPPVLLVEDDRGLAEEIRSALHAGGHRVVHAETRSAGLHAAQTVGPSVLILDRMLNEEDGLSILATLREAGNLVPVLVMSGLSAIDERLTGLKAGGDDYLVKPFDIRELSARVEALLRRASESRATRLRVGRLEMDLIDRQVRRDGELIALQQREFQLLEFFMRRPGQVITREMLLDQIWHYNFMVQTNVVDVHIGKLRRKLDDGEGRRFIVNVRAAGFKLEGGS
jgi:two-component system, OmpR family, response regulator